MPESIEFVVTFDPGIEEKKFDILIQAFQYGLITANSFYIWKLEDGHYYKLITKHDVNGLNESEN